MLLVDANDVFRQLIDKYVESLVPLVVPGLPEKLANIDLRALALAGLPSFTATLSGPR